MKTKLKALIVDDEQSARDNLAYLLNKYCSAISVIGEANKVLVAVEKIKKLQPDIIFLDIEMPQENGFEIFKYFNQPSFHVIFVTAYNHYAVTAFEVSAVDYLLKPVDIERLKEAEQKVVKQKQLNQNFEILKHNIATSEIKNIAIPYKNDFAIVNISHIICVKASRAYSDIIVFEPKTNNEKVFTYAKKLAYFEENLPKNKFVRVHRSWVLNFDFIQSYSKKESVITLTNTQKIPVSKSYKNTLEEQFL